MKKKQQKRIEISEFDKIVVDYIRELSFKRTLFGCREEELWTVVSNIQKYYQSKMDEQRAIYENELAKLRGEIYGSR